MDVVPGNVVDVVGVGTDVTILAAGATPVRVREPAAVLRGLAIVARDPATTLVDLAAGTLEDADVVPRGASGVAVHLGDGATLRRVHVRDAGRYGDQLTTAIASDGAGAALVDSDALAYVRALDVSGGSLAVTRSVLHGGVGTAARVTGGALTADDSAFAGDRAGGALVDVAPVAAVTVLLRSVTLDGAGEAAAGLRAACAGGATADVTLVDSLAVDATTDLDRSGSAACAVALDHVGYRTRDAHGGTFSDGAGVVVLPEDAPTSWSSGGHGVPAPGWGSPAHDGGSGRAAGAGETDLAGAPRVVDGVRDLGALEYQHLPPTVRIEGDATVMLGNRASFEAVARDADGEPTHFSWSVDGAPVALAWSSMPELGADWPYLVTSPVTAGPHAVAVTVTDASGLTARAATTLTATDPPPGLVATPPPGPTYPRVEVPGPGLALYDKALKLRADHRLWVHVACMRTLSYCSGSLRVVLRGKKVAATLGPVAFAVSTTTWTTVKLAIPAKVRRALAKAGSATATISTWHGAKMTGGRWVSAKVVVKP